MRMTNLSSKFLTPVLDLKSPEPVYGPAFKNTYLKMEGYDCEYGKCFFMVYDDSVSSTLEAHFESHPTFTDKLRPKEGETVFVFNIPEERYQTVVKPFIDGKYSRIDRSYVEEKFPKDPLGKLRLNRRILDKDPALRDEWSRRIGVTLPDDAEVWSKAKEADETYGYIEQNLGLVD